MGAPKGSKNALGNIGGGRKGYEYEDAQMKMMKKNINWFLFYIESVRTGKNTEASDKKFKLLEKVLIKMMDKVHPNKNQMEHSGEIANPTPIYGGNSIPKHDSNEKDIPANQENPGS